MTPAARTASTSRSPGPTRSPAQTTERTSSPSTTAPGSTTGAPPEASHVRRAGSRPGSRSRRRRLGDHQVEPAGVVQRAPGDLVEPGRLRLEVAHRPPRQQRGPDVPQVAEAPAVARRGRRAAGGARRPSRPPASPTGSPARGEYASALVSSTAAPSTQSRSRPRAPAVPSASGSSTETWTSRPASAASSWSAWWCALTAVRPTCGRHPVQRQVEQRRGRPPCTAPWVVRRSAAAAGSRRRPPAPRPPASVTAATLSRPGIPVAAAMFLRHARRDRRRRPLPPPRPRPGAGRRRPPGPLGDDRAARLRGRGLPGPPRLRRRRPRRPRPVRAPRPDGRGGVRAGRAQGHAVAPAPRLRDRHLHDRRGDGPPGLQRRRRPDQQRRHPVDDRRLRHPAHRDAARGAGHERRAVPRLPALGEPARATRSGRRRATRTSAAPRSGCSSSADGGALVRRHRRRAARRRRDRARLDVHADHARRTPPCSPAPR